MRDPSVYYKANIKGIRAIINTAIAAGICRLIYTSPASVIFIGTDIMGIDDKPGLDHDKYK
ncbi:hypothetical protein BKA82DRAFT_22439 [Pisolithus tinctorius]|uniref:3-beta hydroxysteroid dehydrogenase/isomerase domain-containing protein n=1 Tax=Pisolithus tinctorius Marx 270 TaxID=870435 RepID=A0A0C3JJG7_PISTI|nr:hypothetical protein BKA82DRAFT_22439 [Pisolithus tinctorius]KIO09253.1 hypothetical protein M404DRAFT_22439 [Pisolithus tinctorius Marx 270]